MAKTIKLFVGGLPPTIFKQELEHVFREYLPYIRIDLRRKDGTSFNKGYAFLLVNDPVIASRIVETQFEVRHRKLQVQYSQKVPKYERIAPLRLFCKGIPADISDEELLTFFSQFVPCRAAYSIKNNQGIKKGYGFIELCTKESARILLDKKTFKIRDNYLVVEEFSRLVRSKPLEFQRTKRVSRNLQIKGMVSDKRVKNSHLTQESNLLTMKHEGRENFSQNEIEFSSKTLVRKKKNQSLKSLQKEATDSIYQGSRTSNEEARLSLGTTLAKNGENLNLQEMRPSVQKLSLLKFAPSLWMARNVPADIQAITNRLDHGFENVRFIVLKTKTPLSSPGY